MTPMDGDEVVRRMVRGVLQELILQAPEAVEEGLSDLLGPEAKERLTRAWWALGAPGGAP